MKFAIVSLIILSTLSLNAFAMSKNIAKIQDEDIDEVSIVKNFNLRATDRSVLSFVTEDDRSEALRSGLPAAENADTSLCGKPADFELFTGATSIAISLLEQKRPLTEAEIALIKRTPRCEPYTAALNLIASILRSSHEGKLPGEQMESLSVKSDKSGSYLVLKTESKKSAAFKISAGLDRIREVRNLDQLKILASSSGQNIGIRFRITEVTDFDPTRTRDHESCTYTHYERQCRYDRQERREICENVRITEEGIRRVISTSNQTLYTIGMEFLDLQGQVVATGEVRDLDWDIDSRYGECEPAHGGGRR